MAQPATNPIARFIVRIFVRLASGWVRGAPKAHDSAVVHRSGPDALRILLVGDGNNVGLGVVTHEVGLAGALASRIASTTRRGVDLELITGERITAEDCFDELSEVDLARYDAVILSIGVTDLLDMRSPESWQFALQESLDVLTNSRVPAFVVAIPVASEDGMSSRWLRDVVRDQTRAMNRVLESFARETRGVSYIPIASLEGRRFVGTRIREYYDEIAAQISPAVSASVLGSVRHHQIQNEARRQRALDAVGIVDTEPEAQLDNIVGAVKSVFSVSTAAITIIDRDRQWLKSVVGMDRVEAKRSEAICNTTIQGEGLFVVEDLRGDPRFAHFPGVSGEEGEDGVRFYAGYPIETPDGFRVGALCIMDTDRHRFSAQDGIVLRDFALEAQRQLWAS